MRPLQALFTLIATIIFVGGIIFWIRSYNASDAARYEINHYVGDLKKTTAYALSSTQGRFQFKFERSSARYQDFISQAVTYNRNAAGEITGVILPKKAPIPADHKTFAHATSPISPMTPKNLAVQSLTGFNFTRNDNPDNNTFTLTLPAWIVVALSSIFPLGRLERLLRRRKNTKKSSPSQDHPEVFPT